MPFSNYQNGFPNGVTIRGVPVLNTYAGKIFYVSSVVGSDGNNGTYLSPYATLDYAIGQCTPKNGDIIFLMPSHNEVVGSAGAITVDVSGVSIIGLGNGAQAATFVFENSVSASIVVSASSVTIENVIGLSGINALTNPFNITGDDFYFDGVWRDTGTTVEALRAMLLTGVNRGTINLQYIGQTGGSSCVNAIRLVSSTDIQINSNFYGLVSTAWVQFLTTACKNINVYGYMYTQGVTNFTRDVVDTVTGSTWWARFDDGSAAKLLFGGSGGALAALT